MTQAGPVRDASPPAWDDPPITERALRAAGDAAYLWHFDDDRLEWGGAARALFGTATPPATGAALEAMIRADDLAHRLQAIAEHLDRSLGKALDCDYRLDLVQHDGCESTIWVHERGRVERDETGRPLCLGGVLRRIDRLKHREAQLARQADIDEMTGRFNRKRLLEGLEAVLADSVRTGIGGAYLSVGIDKLALINDAYGHDTADAVIVAVGERIGALLRPGDQIGRIGGDVYGLVLHSCSQEEAGALAEAILRAVRTDPVATPSGALHVSVSIGIIAFPTPLRAPLEAITRADAAMQLAKRHGRDCYRFYHVTDAQRRDHQRDLEIGERVKEALRDGRLLFAFQPMVSACEHTVKLYECLMRMRQEDGTVLTAARFMPAVERLGLVRAIDRRALELALVELRADDRVSLCVNVSGYTTADRDWLALLVEELQGRPDMARRLVIEITETAATQEIGDTIQFAAIVRGLGCRLALDDFGSGFTSFRHLKALTIDLVKIDGSFVRDVAESPDDRAFVRTLVQLARSFRLTTVAECVESAEAARVLAEEGVDLLQGYHFAAPGLDRPWRRQGGPSPAA